MRSDKQCIFVADCCNETEECHEEDMANAKLICAAPDLLKQLMQVAEAIDNEDWVLLMSASAKTAINAAIAKAKGEV